jgi:HNH endonuclease
MRKYSQELIDKICQDYPHYYTKDIAAKYSLKISVIYNIATRHNLHKSPTHTARMLAATFKSLEESGRMHRFEKGQTAWNKGKHMRVSERTEFKKGNKPHNYRPVGSERVTKDGYLERKIADPSKWKPVHHLEWEKVNGPIPARHKVIFKTPDKLNVSIDNLLLVTFEEAMLRNTIHRYPTEIVKAIKSISKLKKTIRNYGKEQN